MEGQPVFHVLLLLHLLLPLLVLLLPLLLLPLLLLLLLLLLLPLLIPLLLPLLLLLLLPPLRLTLPFPQMMSETSGSTEEDKPIFQPLTRDSLAQIQARIDAELAKKKELARKRAEGEVSLCFTFLSG
jgi:hypothetical protein